MYKGYKFDFAEVNQWNIMENGGNGWSQEA